MNVPGPKTLTPKPETLKNICSKLLYALRFWQAQAWVSKTKAECHLWEPAIRNHRPDLQSKPPKSKPPDPEQHAHTTYNPNPSRPKALKPQTRNILELPAPLKSPIKTAAQHSKSNCVYVNEGCIGVLLELGVPCLKFR